MTRRYQNLAPRIHRGNPARLSELLPSCLGKIVEDHAAAVLPPLLRRLAEAQRQEPRSEARVQELDERIAETAGHVADLLHLHRQKERDEEVAAQQAPRVRPIGALQLWRREVAACWAGQRSDRPSTWILDALYRAACAEANAVDYDAQGLRGAADEERRKAACIILEAAKQKEHAA